MVAGATNKDLAGAGMNEPVKLPADGAAAGNGFEAT